MAIYDLDTGLGIKDHSIPWQDKTGKEVEDYITRNIIIGGEYDTENENLILKKAGGENIEIQVTVQEPIYEYAICLYGLKVNGEVKTSSSLLMLYKKNTKVEVGVAIMSAATRGNNINNYNKRFDVTFSFNGRSFTKDVGNIDYTNFVKDGEKFILVNSENLINNLAWIDVSNLFTKTATEQQLSASFEADRTYTANLNTIITNQVINLVYNGNIVVNTNQLDFGFDNAEIKKSDYKLIYLINGISYANKASANSFTIYDLTPGLNLIVARAENINDKTICTDWVYLNVIYTKDFKGTAIAVNGVSNGISNNGVATLYKVLIYSSEKEEFEFTTYLENEIPSDTNPNPTNIIKTEYIQASSYKENNVTEEYTYKKYIELENTNAVLYLLIKVKNDFYIFYTGSYSNFDQTYSAYPSKYILMEVEPCILKYNYVKTYPISYNFDLITGQSNNLFITNLQSETNATLISDLESSDGWKEDEGLTYLKLSKQNKPILKQPINLNLNDSFTIELGFRTYNISDKNQTILTIGKLGLYPTQLGWIYDDIKSKSFLMRNAGFQEGIKTHITVTVKKGWKISKNDIYYPDYLNTVQSAFDSAALNVSYNLLRIYVNGGIDREFILDNNELNNLKNSLLDINPKSSDIDLYLFRVYNQHALSHEEVIKNYISYLDLKEDKEAEYNKNDILNESGKISWTKCLGKLNTLLFIYHKGGKFPNRFWGLEDNESSNDANKKIPCTLIINYADPVINAKYGGILDKLQCKGQGSSAMRYLIWNVNSSLNKFKYKDTNGEEQKTKSNFRPFSNLLIEEGKSNLLPEGTVSEPILEKYYVMPNYKDEQDTTAYEYSKMVGKVNFASSMQSHKLGACKLYDDGYKNSLGKQLPSGGKKAVHEEPFMYFYIETDTEFNTDYTSSLDVNNITYDKILELGEQAKFMGFLTWGPGKGDDACSGYDEDLTPEYLMLEGGENTDPSVNFHRPWQALQRLKLDFVRDGRAYDYSRDLDTHPTVNKEQSLNEPWAQLLIDDESIVYIDRGAWDIDYGFEEVEINDRTYYDFTDGAKVSLKKFREFLDTVYKYDFTYVTVDSNIKSPQDWKPEKKYLVLSSEFFIDGVAVNNHKSGDLYRYDEASQKWVRAGLYYDNNDWERLNYKELIQYETGENLVDDRIIRKRLQELFISKIQNYIHLNDIAFHLAFIKFLSGTDNRAKNTYFLIIGTMSNGESDYKIRLIGDDLDTILVTDNNGLQSKPYNLIEDSYDESFSDHWGDSGNIFFRMFDVSFEQNIKSQLTKIMDFAGLQPSSVNLKSGYFYNVFFKIQEDFPKIAYNHTATIYYENAYIIKNCGAAYGFDYTNNGVDPIAQSHGSCLETEKQFMKERINFLAGYGKSCLENSIVPSSSAGGGQVLKLLLEFEPIQDFYPTYLYEVGNVKNIGNYSDSNYDIIKYKAVAGQHYILKINELGTAINQNLYQVGLYKNLSITGLNIDDLGPGSFDTLTDFIINNDLIEENKDLFDEDYPQLKLNKITSTFPVLENLNLINVKLPDELDLSNYLKLKTINLSKSQLDSIILPQTGLLTDIVLPETIKSINIYNNPGLKTISFEGTHNINSIYIDGNKCGDFNISKFLEELDASSLEKVDIRNLNNIYVTEEALRKLLVQECRITGELTIIDENGNPKQISFQTKQELVNKFGNIVKGSNGLIINFNSYLISLKFICNQEVNAFYDVNKGGIQTFDNLFGINVIYGNDVIIVDGANPFNPEINGYLDITYSMSNVNNATIDNKTGTVSVSGIVNGAATVTITMRTISGQTFTNESIVSFAWKSPKIGDFAYADGSFSSNFNTSKDLVGLVYAKNGDENSGTVYIIGKEYFNDEGHYSGYSSKDANSLNFESEYFLIYNLQQYVISLNLNSYQPTSVISFNQTTAINEITIDNGNDIMSIPMTGKPDTESYVNLVNGLFLPKIYNSYSNYIKNVNGSCSIESIDKLNQLANKLTSDNLGESRFISALLYPYFYSAYLYEPSVVNGTLDPQYKQGNWYAPSIGELSRIIYYRGYSAKGSGFNASLYVRSSIQSDILNGNTELTTPIFSLALKAMTNANMPIEWNNIVGSGNYGTPNNITTTVESSASDSDNYSYQCVQSYEGTGYVYYSRWVSGAYNQNYYDVSVARQNTWRYTKHKGLPFTLYNYTNPLN